MNKITLIVLICIGSIALLSAVLVPYLSNKDSVDVSVNSPINLTSKLNSNAYFGGETIYYKASATNNLNRTLNGWLSLTITNDLDNTMCSDFELISLINEVDPTPTIFACSDEFGVVKIIKGVTYMPYETESYLGEFTLKPSVEPTSYQVDTQVLSLS